MKFFKLWWAWITRVFRDDTDIVLELISGVAVFVERAIPIVEEVDKLKQDLKEAREQNLAPIRSRQFIEAQLGKYFQDRDEREGLALTLAKIPVADLLFNVAVECLGRLAPNTSVSTLRLAVQLAYNVYKARQVKE